MKILVTGGAGFIGSNFIRHILNKSPDYEVVNLDKLTYAGNLDNLKDIEKNPNYAFIKGDICDVKVVEKAIKGCDCLLNFAAETHVDRSIHNASNFITTNVHGTYELLEAARKNKLKRFIQISTDEVYGSIESGSFSEDSPLKPNSPYAASKAAADFLVRSYVATYKMPLIVTRSSNNFGPHQYPEKFLALIITNALENKKIPVYGEGKNVRDWLYVKDNCEAIEFILKNGKEREVYNISGEFEISNIDLAKLVLKKLDLDFNFIEFVKDRPGHDLRYSLDSTKLKSLGWNKRFDFGQALDETIDWYKKNRPWWQRIKQKDKSYREYYREQYEMGTK
ncbi:MAG: dTDP-glucose 4,6-dehydratase [Omnitrophica WOR_2 bacterium SM23_29]|nr:MAG: dTDP-glucose 4,6-dehydratase [Omnitrophica WOR_2 bacterium SM23_29]